MDATRGRRQRRFIAALLSLHTPGIGQMAIGHWRRGAVFLGAALVAVVAGVAGILTGHLVAFWIVFAMGMATHLASMVDTFFLDRPAELPSGKTVAILVVGCLVYFELMAGHLRRQVVEAFSVPAQSMFPTLRAGDHIWTVKVGRTFSRGDVVVFHYPLAPAVDYVKRIVGLPGDTVEIRAGVLVVNGQPAPREQTTEPCGEERGCTVWVEHLDGKAYRIATDSGRASKDFGPRQVPAATYFVLGDNRDNSNDSRVWGTVPEPLIVGHVRSVWWSSDRSGIRWERINQPVR